MTHGEISRLLASASNNLEEKVRQRTDALQAEIRWHAEAAAQLQERAALLDQASDAIFVRDLNDRVTFWSKGAERLYGWQAENAAGQTTSDLLIVDREAYEEATATALSEGAWTGDLRQRTRNGNEIVVECRWTVLRDGRGKPTGIFSICRDVTEKRQIEDQTLHIRRAESIGALAGGMAHDLNNLLAPIVLGLDLIRPNLSSPDDLELADTMAASARRAAEIIRQVLCFAQGIESERSAVVLSDVFRETVQMLRDILPKGIDITSRAAEDVLPVEADAAQIRQVLLNLALNARDAMPTGGKLTLTARNVSLDAPSAASSGVTSGRYVEVSVTDTGFGMSAEVADKVFEPFFTTKDVGKGTGLGLSAAYGIVRHHKGGITVESTPGAGATFRIYLPAMVSEDVSDMETSSTMPAATDREECVLLIEDEASLLMTTRQALTRNGYRVLTAPDGVDGLACYVENRSQISVVILGMNMPVLDGPVTVRALRKITPGLRVIVVTGGASVPRSFVDLPEGIPLLHKPYTTDALLQVLHQTLSGK